MQDKYREYADIKREIKFLELREAALKEAIIADLSSQKLSKVEGEFGKLTVAVRKVWIYSKKLTKLKEDLKLKEYEEQEKGVAKAKESPYLKFTAPGEDNG